MRSRQSERRSREVDLFRLSGFESYYKINSRGKKTNTGVFLELLRLRHAKTLSLLLVNCHNVTGEIFNQWIRANRYEKSFKIKERSELNRG